VEEDVVDHRQGLRHDVDGVTKICDERDDCDDVVGSDVVVVD
jgi:hypothetical protein